MFEKLYETIIDRKKTLISNSYTVKLFLSGEDIILRKIGEECIEVILSAKSETKERLTEEVADIFYHLLVLLVEKDISLQEIYLELKRRESNR